MSASLLGSGATAAGILYGSIWSMARREVESYNDPLDMECEAYA
jgi:hypothetical protein